MPRPFVFLLVAAFLAPVSGCASSDATAEAEVTWSEGALRDHLRRLVEPLPTDSAAVARRPQYAARRMQAAGLMPAREPSFLLRMKGAPAEPAPADGLPQAHVLGYVAGRHPSYYDELVLVAADLDSPGAAAVLEVAAALVDEAHFTQTPERSVLFALWAPPRTGVQGLRDFLDNPTWALPNVTRALLVSTDSTVVAESRRALEARSIPADLVAVDDQSVAGEGARPEVEQARTLVRTVRLADELYRQIVAAATPRDSTVALP